MSKAFSCTCFALYRISKGTDEIMLSFRRQLQNLIIPSLFSVKSWVFCVISLSVLSSIYPSGSQPGVFLSLRDI